MSLQSAQDGGRGTGATCRRSPCFRSCGRAHASSLFIPTTRLWAAPKSRLLLNQAGFGSRNLSEVSSKHRITDLYAWTLKTPPLRVYQKRSFLLQLTARLHTDQVVRRRCIDALQLIRPETARLTQEQARMWSCGDAD